LISVLRGWFHKYFTDPQAILLGALLIIGFSIVLTFGTMLGPVLIALVVAYLLNGLVQIMEQRGSPRIVAVVLVYILFLALLLFLLVGLLPLISQQTTDLIQSLPDFIAKSKRQLLLLPEQYPDFIRAEQVAAMMDRIKQMIDEFAQNALSYSLASLQGVVMFLVYLILVPLLVFFFLKDKQLLLDWMSGFLPRERPVALAVWREMDGQIANYIRGKFWEIIIVGGVCYAVFAFMGLRFAALLGLAVGLSVIVPYVGAAVVTVPVALIAYFQWGWSGDFFYLMLAYTIVQAIDGNVLVPLLFYEAVNIHPVAIIVAVLFFGGIWGFWGVFFAIPLATLVRAVITAWPRTPERASTTPCDATISPETGPQ